MDLVLRTVFVFLLVMLITRAIGRRELGTLAPFDLILLVVVGDLVQQGVTQNDFSITGTLIVLSTLAVLIVATSYASFRSPRLHRVFEGEPIVLVEHGEVIEANLRRQRMTADELAAAARIHGVARLSKVRFAVLETNGEISFVTE